MPKAKLPVSSFGPELMDALRAGSNEKLTLVFDTPQLAVRFAARINALRSAMKAEKHKDAERLYRAGVSLSRENPNAVVIAPRDWEFRAALTAAKIPTAPDPTEQTIEVPTPMPGVAEDSADSFLGSLTVATSVPKKDGGEEQTSILGVDTGDK